MSQCPKTGNFPIKIRDVTLYKLTQKYINSFQTFFFLYLLYFLNTFYCWSVKVLRPTDLFTVHVYVVYRRVCGHKSFYVCTYRQTIWKDREVDWTEIQVLPYCNRVQGAQPPSPWTQNNIIIKIPFKHLEQCSILLNIMWEQSMDNGKKMFFTIFSLKR